MEKKFSPLYQRIDRLTCGRELLQGEVAVGGVYLKPQTAENLGGKTMVDNGQNPTHPGNGKISPSDKPGKKFAISMSISVIPVHFGPFRSISVHFGPFR